MAELTKKKGNGESTLFPSFRSNFFPNRYFGSGLFDFDNELWNRNVTIPPANIIENEKEFKLELSVPGFKKEDFTIDVEQGALVISSEKKEESNKEEKNYSRKEFSYSSFSRTFQLPDNTDENNISAKYDSGVLQLTIPKKEIAAAKQKKQIKIS
ncbi:MAG TPA: Hsp20/alpha crystallin family protein [Chitinophagales bacterium]|nr:Hsp20/alpha crystallin family protein [Chitinophagales bacterium]